MNKLTSNLKYLRRPPWDSGISPPELLEFIAAHPAGRAIDLGCGTGTNAVTLAQHGWQVSGVDVALIALYRARLKAQSAQVNLDLHLGDVVKLHGIEGEFDLALDMGCFHNLGEEKENYLKRLKEILTPQGFWLLYAHLLPRDDNKTHGLSEADLTLAASYFNLVWEKRSLGRKGRNAIWVSFQKT